MDIASILKDLQGQKAPMECPFCSKVYRSFSGVSYHVVKFHADAHVSPPVSNYNSSFQQEIKKPLSYAEAKRMVEFDLKGHVFRNLISEPLSIEIENNSSDIETEQSEAPTAVKSLSPIKWTPRKRGRGRMRFNHPKNRYMNNLKLKLNGEEKKPSLPVAIYSVLSNDDIISTAVQERKNYYRYIDKTSEELDDEVEYGMDEEDYIWLEKVNENRNNEGLPPVSHSIFEMLMDRLEKESHFETRTVSGDPYNLIDEDAVCSICCDGECSNSNVILFCDMCNLAVHQECYGVPYIPEGQWLCRKCFRSPSKPVSCLLCPTKSGAFKQTDTNHWAHVVCALWIPEVCFANTVFLEPIDSIQNIPAARWKLLCYICKKKEGACIQCFKTNCYTAFHVTCAQQGGLYMKIEAGRAENGQPTIKKSAYCDLHTPKQAHAGFGTPCVSDCGSDEDSDAASVHSKVSVQSKAPVPVTPVNPSAKLKEVQKKLLEKQSFKLPAVHIPFVPAHRLGKIVSKVAIAKKSIFIQQLQSFWMLKRQSRNGVPLLRRLQANTGSGVNKNQREEHTLEEWSQSKELKEQLRYWQQLRHDLERARLLIELIRKRERMKKEQCRMKQQVVDLTLKPLHLEMFRTLELLQERDTADIFANPVDPEQAPDYHEFITQPMDFSTMRQKLNDYEYMDFEQFENDFNQIVENCLNFNKEDTIYYRAAVRLRKDCRSILKMTRRRIKQAGIDQHTGMHMERPPAKLSPVEMFGEDSADDDIASLVDNPFMTIDEKIEELEQKLHLSSTIQSALARLSRQKVIRTEIAKLRRKKRKLTDLNDVNQPDVDINGLTVSETPACPRKRRIVHGKCENSSYNGEVKVILPEAPVPPTLHLPLTSPLSQLPPTEQTHFPTPPVAQNPSPGRNRRSGILFKKKQYQPIKPSPLVLYSSTPTQEEAGENNPPSLKLKLRIETSPSEKPLEEVKTIDIDVSIATDNAQRLNEHISNGLGKEICRTKESRKRSYSSSANSDTDVSVVKRKAHHKRGRQKHKLSLQQEFAGLEGLGGIKCGVYMVTGDDVGLKDPKSDPQILQMLSLIWAKSRGYPSYPALTVDPTIPRAGYQFNGVPISVPPLEVLQMNDDVNNYLILFFDARRTWQWLPRDKIEPLGVDSRLDEVKLIESKKPTMRRKVQEAYKRAISFRNRLEVGESSSDSNDTTHDEINGHTEPDEQYMLSPQTCISESVTPMPTAVFS